MAQQLRNQYGLPTVRISLRPSRSESKVRLQYYAGKHELGSFDFPISAFGIVGELSVRAYREATLHLPDDVASTLSAVMQPQLRPGEPLWLIVEPNGYLAVVPW